MEQIDLAPSNLRADHLSWREGQQEFELALQQHHHHSSDSEQWFQHIDKQTITIEAFPETSAELDSWKGPVRSYWILSAYVNEVKFLTVLSGFDEKEIGAILGKLAPFKGNDHLAEWHDKEHREYRERRS